MMLVIASIALLPIGGAAQEPKTEAGARAAVIAMLQHRQAGPDSVRIVTDSIGLHRALTQCHDVSGGPPACTLIEGREVIMAIVHLTGPASAAVELLYYQVMRGSCPLGTPYAAPVIGYTRTDRFTMSYADGHWKAGAGRGVEC